ncbi:hypothetical protein EHO60_13735 [Leptospira fletcheri]|uniref:Lipoprotein n=1 Tax=Leptospira fletcheri TaxID=2484981 RepID=A0A4R9GBL3_9LEPT|nr:hypothetical protein [Leptospira fletcheri]TGK09073.1 hypothetical protein EHO60_13735 [Leptospira fletcheri]
MKISSLFSILLLLALFSCKKEKPTESEPVVEVDYFQKYNNPKFKLTDYPEIQGVYTIDGYAGIFRRLGMSEDHPWYNSSHCTEFDPARNKLKIRVATEKKDIEIDIINRIGENIYLSKNHKVVRVRLLFNEKGELSEYFVFELDNDEKKKDAITDKENRDPNTRKSVNWAQGPLEGYKECIQFIEESIKVGQEESGRDY